MTYPTDRKLVMSPQNRNYKCVHSLQDLQTNLRKGTHPARTYFDHTFGASDVKGVTLKRGEGQ